MPRSDVDSVVVDLLWVGTVDSTLRCVGLAMLCGNDTQHNRLDFDVKLHVAASHACLPPTYKVCLNLSTYGLSTMYEVHVAASVVRAIQKASASVDRNEARQVARALTCKQPRERKKHHETESE